MAKQRILFLTIYSFNNLSDGYIFADLVTEFRDAGHDVTVLMPSEGTEQTLILEKEGISQVKVASGAIQKTSSIQKIINLYKLDAAAKKILKKNFTDKFDLVVCMISHCAFYKTVKFIKQRDGAFIYNMVKDIFPQNAVDMGMLSKGGLKGLLYKYFKHNELNYYKISDALGAISPAAVEFLKGDNPQIEHNRFEVNPNSVIAKDFSLIKDEIEAVREKHDIPQDKTIFVYGGNLGVPQGVEFLLEVLAKNENRDDDAYFVIAGDGTQFDRIAEFFSANNPQKAKLIKRLSSSDFEELCLASDVGLVFLNKAFTIPNYPSRVLSYMQARLPIVFAVDSACDAGRIAEANEYGFNCLSGETDKFFGFIDELLEDEDKHKKMGQNAYNYLCNNYTAKQSYDIIIKHVKKPTEPQIHEEQTNV